MTISTTLSLDSLPLGLSARIIRVGATVPYGGQGDPDLEELLLGLGFEEGAEIEIRHQGAFGGPLAVRVDGRMIAIRPIDATAVLVEATMPVSAPVLDARPCPEGA